MPYVPNATDTSQPTTSQTVESAALEFRTLKIRVNALETAMNVEDVKDLRVPEISVPAIPPIATRAGKVLGFDAGGNPVAVAVAGTTDPSLRTDLAASGGSALVGFLQAGTNAEPRSAQSKMRDVVSVKDFGAVGDGVTDDTAAIQTAADRAMAIRGTLYFPEANAGAYYKITAPITFTSVCHILGAGPIGTTVLGVGLSAGTYLFDFDCLAANSVEQIDVSRMTLRSDNASPRAMRLKNVSYFSSTDLRVYNLAGGIDIDGTRCFSHTVEALNSYLITNATVRWLSTFNGGGQFTFVGCTFAGDYGVHFISGAFVDDVSFTGCNWEQCFTHSMYVQGTCAGLSVVGSRTEGCNGVDFNIAPSGAAEYVGGLNISGNVFSASDAGSIGRIYLGGGSGKVRGFSVAGNVVTHGTDSFSGSLVHLNGDGESGVVAGNYLRGTTATAVNTQRNGVVVFGNENLSGKLAEWWGLASWVAKQSSYTATATGMTTSPTGTVKYSVVGNTVTLDIPSISGTSNATTFTLTGGPTDIRPAADKDVLLSITDNGTGAVGFARVKTTGVIELYATVAGNSFANSGTKAVRPNSITYTLA